MTRTAKAKISLDPGTPMVFEEVLVDDPRASEVLIEVRASGICHSDLTAATLPTGWPTPAVLGHEVAGVVVATGPAVTHVGVGDRVLACEVEHCGHCPDCVRGRIYRCQNPHEIFRSADDTPRISWNGKAVSQFSGIGGFMDHVLLHSNAVMPIPDSLPFAQAAIMGCSVATGFGAVVNTAGVQLGDTVAIVGCGGVGLNAVQGARLVGARRIIAIDINDKALTLAARLGATDVVHASGTDPVAAVSEITRGVGVDYAFEMVGKVETCHQAREMTRPTGTAYLAGIPHPDAKLELNPLFDLMLTKKSIATTFMGSSNFPYDLALVADLYLQGRYNLDDLVARTCSLDAVEDGFSALQRGEIARTVVVFD